MHDKLFSVTTEIQKDIVLKLNPFKIYEISWFPRQPFMDSNNEGVWGSPNEQFGSHEKLAWDGWGQGRARYAQLNPW